MRGSRPSSAAATRRDKIPSQIANLKRKILPAGTGLGMRRAASATTLNPLRSQPTRPLPIQAALRLDAQPPIHQFAATGGEAAAKLKHVARRPTIPVFEPIEGSAALREVSFKVASIEDGTVASGKSKIFILKDSSSADASPGGSEKFVEVSHLKLKDVYFDEKGKLIFKGEKKADVWPVKELVKRGGEVKVKDGTTEYTLTEFLQAQYSRPTKHGDIHRSVEHHPLRASQSATQLQKPAKRPNTLRAKIAAASPLGRSSSTASFKHDTAGSRVGRLRSEVAAAAATPSATDHQPEVDGAIDQSDTVTRVLFGTTPAVPSALPLPGAHTKLRPAPKPSVSAVTFEYDEGTTSVLFDNEKELSEDARSVCSEGEKEDSVVSTLKVRSTNQDPAKPEFKLPRIPYHSGLIPTRGVSFADVEKQFLQEEKKKELI